MFDLPMLPNRHYRIHILLKIENKFLLRHLNVQFFLANFAIPRNDENHDLEEIADGLIDLIIVALGTAAMMGLPLDDMFQEVHEANMRKVRVEHAGESKRGHGFDLKKPVDWKGPNLRKFL